MFLKKKQDEKSCLFGMIKSINADERTIEIIASTSERDRHGDIVLPEAFTGTLGSFLANPVILAGHQHRLDNGASPVIGSAIPETVKVGKNDVTMTIRFATTELADQYWSLYRDGHMKAFSIGFIPIEFKDEKDENLGWIRTYTKIELLEVSAVAVPSNRTALAMIKEAFGSREEAKDIPDTVEAFFDKKFQEQRIWIEEQLEQIKDMIAASDRFAEELLSPDSSAESPDPDDDDAQGRLLEQIKYLQKKIETIFKEN